MSDNIVIIDYKMGNLRSVQKAFEKMGSEAIISNNPEVINSSSKIVLPGVGSFSDGMKNLREMGLIPILEKEILHNKKPFLGICVGIAAVVALVMLSSGLQAGIANEFASIGSDKLFVRAASAGFGPPGTAVSAPLTVREKEIIEDLKGVKVATGRLLRVLATSLTAIFVAANSNTLLRSFPFRSWAINCGLSLSYTR